MQRIALMFILLFLVSSVQAQNADDLTDIQQTALNYMEAWYQGDKKKMKESLHKKLAKRSLQYGYQNKAEIKHTKASHMISYTAGGIGKGLWTDGSRIEVSVLDHFKNIASVKVLTPHYNEYLHLVKIDNRWVIINALYESSVQARE